MPSQDKKSVLHAGPQAAKLAAKRKIDQRGVDVSAETWQLLKEYKVPDILERIYDVRIRAPELPSKQVQLTVHGRGAEKVASML
ncbi:hypothetical protein AAVH_32467, partial [Aphelenchoides avenae]